MEELSYLEKLLDGVEVEWRKLGNTTFFEIANNERKPVKSSLRVLGNIPYYGANNIQDYVDGYTHDGEYVLIAEDGSASLKNYSIQYTKNKFWANNHVHVIQGKKNIAHSRFIYHYLHTVNFIPFLSGGDRAKLTRGKLIEIKIPIPCPDNPEKSLAIQSKIVRILDKFSSYTTELTTELTARKKQYQYYREKLLTFGDEVEWKKIKNVLVRTKGTKITAGKMKELHQEDAPLKIFAGGKTVAFCNLFDVPEKDINKEPSIIVKSRGVIEFEYYNRPFTHKNEMWSYHSQNPNVLIKYVYYYLKLNEPYFQKIGSEMQMPQISTPDTENFLIPIPPLAEQERIIKILDKFDALINSIAEGLPREIKLRQKQYEHYRDLLFSFPKSKNA